MRAMTNQETAAEKRERAKFLIGRAFGGIEALHRANVTDMVAIDDVIAKASDDAHLAAVVSADADRLAPESEKSPVRPSPDAHANAAAIALVRKRRIDAENSVRDEQSGIDMLRTWLRGLHIDLVGGWDQDTPQGDLAKLLGEHPRGHARQFKVAVL